MVAEVSHEFGFDFTLSVLVGGEWTEVRAAVGVMRGGGLVHISQLEQPCRVDPKTDELALVGMSVQPEEFRALDMLGKDITDEFLSFISKTFGELT